MVWRSDGSTYWMANPWPLSVPPLAPGQSDLTRSPDPLGEVEKLLFQRGLALVAVVKTVLQLEREGFGDFQRRVKGLAISKA